MTIEEKLAARDIVVSTLVAVAHTDDFEEKERIISERLGDLGENTFIFDLALVHGAAFLKTIARVTQKTLDEVCDAYIESMPSAG